MMPRKKSKKKLYFGPEVQDAIIRYNSLNPDKDISARNKIYQEEIHKAFDKLCENIINTFKFTYFDDPFEDVKHEVTTFLVMNMHKYDHTKGSKAFSYFSIVAKNYLILHNNNNYKKLKSHGDVLLLDNEFNTTNRTRSLQVKEDVQDLTEQLIQYFEYHIPHMFRKKRDVDVAYSIIELFIRREEIENFNKKSLYVLIREMTGVHTTNITKVVNELKKRYRKIVKEYHSNGIIKIHKQNNYF